jgi:acyl carrier protein phosphodiesterase
VGLWVLAGLALIVALVALATARRTARRLDALTQSYWELRYDYTRLRSQVSRLDPEQAEPAADEAPAAAPATVSFVPLASMRKK